MLIFFHSAKNGKGWTYGDLKMNFLYCGVCSKIGIYGVTKPWVKQIREFLRAFTYCYCMSVWIIIACLQLLLPFARRCDLCVCFTNLTWVVWISGNVTNLWGIFGGERRYRWGLSPFVLSVVASGLLYTRGKWLILMVEKDLLDLFRLSWKTSALVLCWWICFLLPCSYVERDHHPEELERQERCAANRLLLGNCKEVVFLWLMVILVWSVLPFHAIFLHTESSKTMSSLLLSSPADRRLIDKWAD